MDLNERNTGTVHALLERLANERLPRALELKERVDAGECLSAIDMEFLERVFREASENGHLFLNFPQYKDVVAQTIRIYHDIVAKALENEQRKGS